MKAYPTLPTLLENAVHNEWQFQALVTGNRAENQCHLSCTKQFWPKFKRDINCSLKRSNQHFGKKSFIPTKFHEIL